MNVVKKIVLSNCTQFIIIIKAIYFRNIKRKAINGATIRIFHSAHFRCLILFLHILTKQTKRRRRNEAIRASDGNAVLLLYCCSITMWNKMKCVQFHSTLRHQKQLVQAISQIFANLLQCWVENVCLPVNTELPEDRKSNKLVNIITIDCLN